MKTIEYYMGLPYRMEIVRDVDEGGFVASFPDLKGCITCGATVEAAAANASGNGWLPRWRTGMRYRNRPQTASIPGSSSCVSPSPCIGRWRNTPSRRASA